jgi:hypothetical protein
MADNTEVKVKIGETGFVLDATLKGDDGTLVDLTLGGNWTVTISVTARKSTINLLDGSTMVPRNQNAHKGEATYTFTEDDALIPAGKYDLEITAIEPNGRIHKFPKVPGGSTFGTIHMVESKG